MEKACIGRHALSEELVPVKHTNVQVSLHLRGSHCSQLVQSNIAHQGESNIHRIDLCERAGDTALHCTKHDVPT